MVGAWHPWYFTLELCRGSWQCKQVMKQQDGATTVVLVMAFPTHPRPPVQWGRRSDGQRLWPHPASPRALLLPSPGTTCRLPCHGLSRQARRDAGEPRNLFIAGDAAHRSAGPRILRFALGHAVRMLPEPAASSRDERSQPVPSCGTRPAAEPPGPCSAAGRRRGGKAGRKNPAFGRLWSPPSRTVLCVCALRCLALFG